MPLFPGFDTLGTLAHIMRTGHDHTWFVLTQKIIEKEFALSGSEQNPDITGKSVREAARDARRLGRAGAGRGVQASTAPTSSSSATCATLVEGMNALTDEPLLDFERVEREVVARDREIDNPFTKDLQVTAIHGARRYLGDRLTRVAAPHKLLDPDAGPLIAVKLHILTRKTLGGLQTDLYAPRARHAAASPCPACTPPARSPASAAAGCTATARSRAPSSAAASSPAAPRAGRCRGAALISAAASSAPGSATRRRSTTSGSMRAGARAAR